MTRIINLYRRDMDVLFDFSNTSTDLRDVSGFGNNLANPLWGSADQPFLRLAPDAYAGVNSPRGVEVDAFGRPVDADPGLPGIQERQTLPNERLVSDVLSNQIQPLDGNGQPTDSMPNPFGTNLMLMLFGQFFDHGLDFLRRGGGTYTIDLSALPADVAATDPILSNLPPGFPPAMFQGRGARYTDNGDGTYSLDNTDGTLHLNKTSPFVDQNQTYGSIDEITYLLRESVFDGAGNVIGKTHRLLDGPADAGGRATLARYQDILTNNGLSQADVATALTMAAAGSDYDAWIWLSSRPGFVDFNDAGDAFQTPLLGDKNDFSFSPFNHNGGPNPNFNLSGLLGHYIAGDHRANENVGLTAIHTVWHREHNYQAELLAAANPAWNAEQVFQAAKIIVEAEYQRLVFDEFSTAMSGDQPVSEHGFSGYNPNVNPGISEEFASAVYRVGHSMINETLSYVDSAGVRHEISLIQAFLNPALFASNLGGQSSTSSLIDGATQVAHQEIDQLMVNAVRNMLLGQPLDLGALNIARGREVGLPSLNELRATIAAGTLLDQAGQASDYRDTSAAQQGLTIQPYTGWADFGAHLRDASILVDFIALYGIHSTLQAATTFAGKHAAATALMGNAAFMNSTATGLNNVDLWIGGLAEANFDESQMGSTFTWVFQEQLDRLQDGDRFYYTERLDGTTLVAEIRAQTFSDIIARNTGLEYLHDDIFAVAHRVGLADDGNADGNANTANFSAVPAAVVNADALIIVGNAAANTIVGSVGDDTVYGEAGNDSIAGGLGNDGLRGGQGNDTLDGGDGDDRVFGDEGDDSLAGGLRKDKLFGGDGDDSLAGGADDDDLFGGGGMDRLIGGLGKDYMDGGDGIDTADYSGAAAGVAVTVGLSQRGTGGEASGDILVNVEIVAGSNFADNLAGDATANVLEGRGGNDLLSGGGGADRLDGGAGADTMMGGAGNDTYVVDSAGDVVNETAPGSSGADTVIASISYTAGVNVENITLSGSANINATGNGVENALTGNGARNTLSGLDGNDTLLGLGGDDTLNGGNGDDILDGGVGADRMTGLAGDDTYYVDNTADVVNENAVGSSGIDAIYATVTFATSSGVENLTLLGTAAINATGNGSSNVLTGNTAANTLNGQGGDDVLIGGAGNDVLNGGAGGDTLAGGLGNDTMDGGTGTDIFVFQPGFGNDTVIGFDFNPTGGQDLLDISALGISAANFSTQVDITDTGPDILVTMGANSITLTGVANVGLITTSDFLLAL